MLRVQIQQTVPNPLLLQLEVAAGEVHALVGPSGSGKTSVLRSIAGLHHPETGFIECNGDVWLNRDSARGSLVALPANQRSCGFLFQQYALFPHLSALENVCIALYNQIPDLTARKQKAQEWLDQLSIGELSARLPNQLSGGQQQRVGIARAIVTDPALLVADEPTGALDAKSADDILDLLGELRKSLKKTIIIVTHDPRAAERADREVHLDKGQLVSAR